MRWVAKELIQTKKPHKPRSESHVRRCYVEVVEAHSLRRILLDLEIEEAGASEFISPSASSCQGKFPLLPPGSDAWNPKESVEGNER